MPTPTLCNNAVSTGRGRRVEKCAFDFTNAATVGARADALATVEAFGRVLLPGREAGPDPAPFFADLRAVCSLYKMLADVELLEPDQALTPAVESLAASRDARRGGGRKGPRVRSLSRLLMSRRCSRRSRLRHVRLLRRGATGRSWRFGLRRLSSVRSVATSVMRGSSRRNFTCRRRSAVCGRSWWRRGRALRSRMPLALESRLRWCRSFFGMTSIGPGSARSWPVRAR